MALSSIEIKKRNLLLGGMLFSNIWYRDRQYFIINCISYINYLYI